jgi:hypothetical protein
MKMFKSLTIAAGLAASLALFTDPAAAQYRRYPDPGPAIALGMFGAIVGAAIAAQAPPVYAPPQDEYNAPPPPDDPRSFCAAGFFWDGEQCEAD